MLDSYREVLSRSVSLLIFRGLCSALGMLLGPSLSSQSLRAPLVSIVAFADSNRVFPCLPPLTATRHPADCVSSKGNEPGSNKVPPSSAGNHCST